MEELRTYNDYKEFKGNLDQELQNQAEGFVRIGYLLKQARDTDILSESGYKTVNEFAEREYGIDKSVVSRFIRINDRFSEGGYSMLLKKEYREYGYAKLAIMIQLPDEINEDLSPSMSKEEINQIKKAVVEEHSVTDIERMLEPEPPEEPLLELCIRQLWKTNPEIYLEMVCQCKGKGEDLVNQLIPNEIRTLIVALPKIGAVMIHIQLSDPKIKLTKMRTMEKETYPKTELAGYMGQGWTREEAIAEWEKLFNEEWQTEERIPKKREVAPVQPQPEEKEERSPEMAPCTEQKLKPDAGKAAGPEEELETEPPEAAGSEEMQLERQPAVEVIDEWEKLYKIFKTHIQEASRLVAKKDYNAAMQCLNRAIIVVNEMKE